jgi:hypothetical protein
VLDAMPGRSRIEIYNAAGDLVFLIDPRGIWASDGGWTGAPPADLPTGEWVRMGDTSGRGEISWGDQAETLQTRGRILASRTGTIKRLITESPKAVAVGTAARTELRTSDAAVRDFTILVDTLRVGSPCMVAAAGPVGAIIGKVAIRNSAGTIIGFLPVYDVIP